MPEVKMGGDSCLIMSPLLEQHTESQRAETGSSPAPPLLPSAPGVTLYQMVEGSDPQDSLEVFKARRSARGSQPPHNGKDFV